jgi:hypothetical protein
MDRFMYSYEHPAYLYRQGEKIPMSGLWLLEAPKMQWAFADAGMRLVEVKGGNTALDGLRIFSPMGEAVAADAVQIYEMILALGGWQIDRSAKPSVKELSDFKVLGKIIPFDRKVMDRRELELDLKRAALTQDGQEKKVIEFTCSHSTRILIRVGMSMIDLMHIAGVRSKVTAFENAGRMKFVINEKE